jgi:hypothetical protein
VAATGLLMDPAWKSVSGVTTSFGSAEPAVFTPKPRAHAMRPPSMTAMLTPGTWWWAMRSSSVQRTGGRPAISTDGRRPRSTFATCGSWAALVGPASELWVGVVAGGGRACCAHALRVSASVS